MSFVYTEIKLNSKSNTDSKMSSSQDFNIPEAKDVKKLVDLKKTEIVNKKKMKQLSQFKFYLHDISSTISEMMDNGFTITEYFVENGDMNGPIEDYDLCKGGEVICMIVEYLEGKGYHSKIEEGKFKQIHKYGTYITISLEPFPEEDYGYDDY